MEEIIPTNEYTVIDNAAYANPQVALDESNKFIDNYRAIQAADTAQIASDTQNLSTDVPSSQGGLGGATSYFTSRYQTPQTVSAIADLRATAQSKALSDIMSNEQAHWKQKYSDAYRAAQKRAVSTNTNNTNDSNPTGDVDYKATDSEDNAAGTANSVGTIELPSGSGDITMVQVDDEIQYIDNNTGERVVTDLDGNIKRRNIQAFIEQQKKVINEGK